MKRILAILLTALLLVYLLPPAAFAAASMVEVNQNLVAPPAGVGRDYIPVKITWTTTNDVDNATNDGNIRNSYLEAGFSEYVVNLQAGNFYSYKYDDYANGNTAKSVVGNFNVDVL